MARSSATHLQHTARLHADISGVRNRAYCVAAFSRLSSALGWTNAD